MTEKQPYQYAMSYQLGFERGPFTKEQLIAKDNPDLGGADAVLVLSMLFPPDGSANHMAYSFDGRTGEPADAATMFKGWSHLAYLLANSPQLPHPWKAIAGEAFQAIRTFKVTPSSVKRDRQQAVLMCAACGHDHRLDVRTESREEACESCGWTLSVPSAEEAGFMVRFPLREEDRERLRAQGIEPKEKAPYGLDVEGIRLAADNLRAIATGMAQLASNLERIPAEELGANLDQIRDNIFDRYIRLDGLLERATPLYITDEAFDNLECLCRHAAANAEITLAGKRVELEELQDHYQRACLARQSAPDPEALRPRSARR